MSDALGRIPISPANRWCIFRYDYLPGIAFFLLLAACGWMWRNQVSPTHVLGEVETPTTTINSPADGFVRGVYPDGEGHFKLYDPVEIGDLVAKIEPFTTEVTGVTALDSAMAADPDESTTEPSSESGTEAYSPFRGTVVRIHCWPGQRVRAGDPMVTISASQGQFVVSHIPEIQTDMPSRGDAVTLRAVGSRSMIDGVVDEVGIMVTSIPDRQLASTAMEAYGIPIRIRLPEDHSLRPGALIEIRFH